MCDHTSACGQYRFNLHIHRKEKLPQKREPGVDVADLVGKKEQTEMKMHPVMDKHELGFGPWRQKIHEVSEKKQSKQ